MGTISRRGFLAFSLAACAMPALVRATEGDENREVAWLSEVQQAPADMPSDVVKLSPLLIDAQNRPIVTLEAWRQKRETIRRWWLDYLKPLEVDRSRAPQLTVLEEDRPEGVVRQLVRYEVEPGVPVEAYLLKPAQSKGPRPGVVALHSTFAATIRQPAGIEGQPEKAFGLNLARRGCVVFCPRNFLWPSNLEDEASKKLSFEGRVKQFQERHPGSCGMAKMLFDAMVAVDILAGLPEVDPQRLGAVGHSLGAKEALYLAALDERIRVTVSSEGGIGTRFCNWDAPWYLGPGIRDERFDHEHHELLALVAPRAFLLVGGGASDGPKSWPFIAAVLPVYRLYGGAPRIALYCHGKGHTVPPEAESRLYEWFETYLGLD